MNDGKHGQGTHSTKMGDAKSAENTPNAQNVSTQIVYPSSKVLDFDEKKVSLGVRCPWLIGKPNLKHDKSLIEWLPWGKVLGMESTVSN